MAFYKAEGQLLQNGAQQAVLRPGAGENGQGLFFHLPADLRKLRSRIAMEFCAEAGAYYRFLCTDPVYGNIVCSGDKTVTAVQYPTVRPLAGGLSGFHIQSPFIFLKALLRINLYLYIRVFA